MTVVCADVTPWNLNLIQDTVCSTFPQAEVHGFSVPREALAYIDRHGCDVLVTEVEMIDRGNAENRTFGLTLTAAAKQANPQVNVVLVTVCDSDELPQDVVDDSRYVAKPCDPKRLVYALEHPRYPLPT